MTRRVLLLSAYDANSHRLWRERLLAMFPDWHWQVLTLPPRHFNWRIRGNSLQWALQQQEILGQHWDTVLATSMVDLAGLRGLVPGLANIPSILYFHENQFDYPPGSQQQPGIETQLVPVYSALCADRIVFNSEYNRRGFMEGVRSLFKRLPDSLGLPLMSRLEHSQVIPVPLDAGEFYAPAQATGSPLLEIAWNHRWEYDKGPELLLALARIIAADSLPLRLHLLGQSFRNSPAEFAEVRGQLGIWAAKRGQSAPTMGYELSRIDYLRRLARSHVVLSTARHDFQGLSVQEGCASGCTAVVPDDLVYHEYLPAQFRYARSGSLAQTAGNIATRLMLLHDLLEKRQPLPGADMSRYFSRSLRADYAGLFDGMIR